MQLPNYSKGIRKFGIQQWWFCESMFQMRTFNGSKLIQQLLGFLIHCSRVKTALDLRPGVEFNSQLNTTGSTWEFPNTYSILLCLFGVCPPLLADGEIRRNWERQKDRTICDIPLLLTETASINWFSSYQYPWRRRQGLGIGITCYVFSAGGNIVQLWT
jgi:hypothetical protein